MRLEKPDDWFRVCKGSRESPIAAKLLSSFRPMRIARKKGVLGTETELTDQHRDVVRDDLERLRTDREEVAR